MLSVFGIVVFLAIFGGMLRAKAYRWRYLAKFYAKPSSRPIERRTMQSVVLIGLGAFNSLKGIVTIGTHETGISLNVMKPFSLFHDPLFIPYSDIRGWQTNWYLDASSSELEIRRAPDVKIVVPAELAEWIQSFAGNKMTLRDSAPPQGNAGRGWHIFTLVNAGVSLGMIAWLSVYLITGQKP